jgi:hypothetical protein
LGRHLNTLTLTFTYTREDTEQNEPRWLSRLPRLSIGQSMSLSKEDGSRASSRTRLSIVRVGGNVNTGAIGQDIEPPADAPRAAARRQRHQKHHSQHDQIVKIAAKGADGKEEIIEERIGPGEQAWQEGGDIIVENSEGEVIRKISSNVQGSVLPAGKAKEDMDRRRLKAHSLYGKFRGMVKHTNKDNLESNLQETQIQEEEERTDRGRKGHREDEHQVMVEYFTPGEKESTRDIEMRPIESRTARYEHNHDDEESPDDITSDNMNIRPIADPGSVVVDSDRRKMVASDAAEADAKTERQRETSVERRRREAVLGLIDDDSESDAEHTSSSSKGKQPETSGDIEDSSEGQTPDERPATLLQAPHRSGIRFGDVSVEGGSFSIDNHRSFSGRTHSHSRSKDRDSSIHKRDLTSNGSRK